MKKNLWIILGFLTFGLTTGYITGLSTGQVTEIILPSLYAFIGGSAIWITKEASIEQRNYLGQILIALCFGTLFGLNTGILIKTNGILVPKTITKENPYIEILKSDRTIPLDSLKEKIDERDNGIISNEQLINWIRDYEKKNE